MWSNNGDTCSVEFYFSQTEHENVMKMIKEVSPKAYNKLLDCAQKSGCHCLRKATAIDDGPVKIDGYLMYFLDPEFLGNLNDEDAREYLKVSLDAYANPKYEEIFTKDEEIRAKINEVLEMVKSIDRRAYDAIVKKDPAGKKHVHIDERLVGAVLASVKPLTDDGLPLIQVGASDFFAKSKKEQRFIIAHELAHYKFGHFKELIVFRNSSKDHLIKLAAERSLENEADRSAVLDFGVNVDDVIEILKAWAKEEYKTPKTLGRTHPTWAVRLKHAEELRRELETRPKGMVKPIDYEELAGKYLKSLRKFGLTK